MAAVIHARARVSVRAAHRIHEAAPSLPLVLVADEALGKRLAADIAEQGLLTDRAWMIAPPDEEGLYACLARVEAERRPPARSALAADLGYGAQAALEALPVMTWAARADGTVDFRNRRWPDDSGAGERGPRGLETLVHAEDRPAVQAAWDRARRARTALDVTARVTTPGGDRGHRIQADAVAEGGRWIGTCIAADYPGESEIAAFLGEMAERVCASCDPEDVLKALAAGVVPRFAQVCLVAACEDGCVRVACAEAAPGAPRVTLHRCAQETCGWALGGVARTGEAELFADLEGHEDPMIPVVAHRPRSLLRVPLPAGAKGRGGVVSFVLSEEGRRYGEADVALAWALARIAALALAGAHRAHALTRARVRHVQDLEALAASAERGQALAALGAQSARDRRWLTAVFDSLGEGLVATDATGVVRLWSAAAHALTGTARSEALGQPLAAVFRGEDLATGEALSDPAARVLAGLACPPERARLAGRAGSAPTVTYQAAPIRLADHRVAGVVIVFQDVSAERRFEEDLLKAQKLESVGVLAGGIAHDFNNILTAIVGNLTLAQMVAREPERLRQALAEAESAAWRARALTHRLVTFAQGGAPIKKPGSLADLLRVLADRPDAAPNTRCELVIEEALWPVAFDAGQLSQALKSLLSNAAEAMPHGGRVSVTARNVGLDAPKSGLPAGPYVRVTVADEGVGIPRECLTRIFDPYFTTKPGASGLGLASAYSIVRRHGGVMRVESHPGQGSTFEILLPAEARPPQPRRVPAPAGDKRVLVMDDEPSLLQVAAGLLGHLGYTVAVAADGEEALAQYRAARDQGRPFAVVILDLTVPGGMGGRECLRHLSALDPSVRAIVASGYSHDPIIAECERFGFRAAVGKPYSLEDLTEALARALAHPAP